MEITKEVEDLANALGVDPKEIARVASRVKAIEEKKKNRTGFSFETTGEATHRMDKILDLISKKSRQGTGLTITVEDNGGDKDEFYIDGDGGDYVYYEADEEPDETIAESAKSKKVEAVSCPQCQYNGAPMGKSCAECGKQIVD